MTIDPITAVAVVGVGAILPDAPDAATFWANVRGGRYSITDVDPERWDPAFYYDANPKAPDKTYSKIGGWVRDWTWDPLAWKLPIPPRVGEAMDDAQKWAVACTRAALLDYGWPERPIDGERTAVVLGNAMSGEHHYLTALRIAYPELALELDRAPTFQALPSDVRKAISAEFGELLGRPLSGDHRGHDARRARQLHGRPGGQPVRPPRAQLRRRRRLRIGPRRDRRVRRRARRRTSTTRPSPVASTATWARRASSSSARSARCRPPAHGPSTPGPTASSWARAPGCSCSSGLADAERDGDRIYAVLRGIGGASDGRGKGITAPNPVGQRLAVERAWRNAGAVAGVVRDDRVPRHVDPRRRRRRGDEHRRGVRRGRPPAGLGGDRFGQVEHRPPQGRRRRRRAPQGGDGAPPQGAAAQPARRGAEPQHRLGDVAVRGEHRAAARGMRPPTASAPPA